MKQLRVICVALLVCLLSFTMVKAQTIESKEQSKVLKLQGDALEIQAVEVYELTLQIEGECKVSEGSDVTDWFLNQDGSKPFVNDREVAIVSSVNDAQINIRIQASHIKDYQNSSDNNTLYVLPDQESIPDMDGIAVEVGSYQVPVIQIDSSLYASAYTYSKSTLKEALDQRVHYEDGSKADITLTMDGLQNEAIDSSTASVSLVEGDGYYVDEYKFQATTLNNAWQDGKTIYVLKDGDLEPDRSNYILTDTNSGKEWSCLGGDGSGHYTFRLLLSGLHYHGLPLPDRIFENHVYIYGQNFVGLANMTFQNGMSIDASFATLAQRNISQPTVTTQPVWTWIGAGEQPILCDDQADDIYISWPQDMDASSLTREDVQITLTNAYGDNFVLNEEDYEIVSHQQETQIAITLLYLPNTPVYTDMNISIQTDSLTASKSYQIASVYVHETQQGGGGATVDGTVTAYSFYGIEEMTDKNQIVSNAYYVLSYEQDNMTWYYAENEQGEGVLVKEKAQAMTFDASGEEDENIQVINNTVYVTTRVGATRSMQVGKTTYTFQKSYSGGRLLNPVDTNGLVVEKGYVLPDGEGWATHESWPWYSGLSTRWEKGWTGIDVQPEGSHFTVKVAKGSSQQFSADGSFDQVEWRIVGETNDVNTTISKDGVLTIGEEEQASIFVVYARAKTYVDTQDQGAVAISVSEQVKVVDTSQLEALLAQYAKLDQSAYQNDSYQAFQTIYEKANMLLQQESKTQAEVDEMSAALHKAYEDLVPWEIAKKEENKQNQETQQKETVDTGDTSMLGFVGCLCLFSLGIVCYSRKKAIGKK